VHVAASEYRSRTSPRSRNVVVDGGNAQSTAISSRRRFIIETLSPATSAQSAGPATAAAAAGNQDDRPGDVLVVILAVVTLFLIVVIITFTVTMVVVVVVFGRRGGYGRRWPTQKSLLSDGENGDSFSSTAASTREGCASTTPGSTEDSSSELRHHC